MQCSAKVCYANLVVYTLARILHARLGMQGHAAMPTWFRKWWAALRAALAFPPLPVRGAKHMNALVAEVVGSNITQNNLAQKTFDPASLYKLAMSKVV